MGELGEYWREHKEHKRQRKEEDRERRNKNTEAAMRLLNESGFEYEILNHDPMHILIQNFQFWPTTGTWINQDTGHRGFGIKTLLKMLEL